MKRFNILLGIGFLCALISCSGKIQNQVQIKDDIYIPIVSSDHEISYDESRCAVYFDNFGICPGKELKNALGSHILHQQTNPCIHTLFIINKAEILHDKDYDGVIDESLPQGVKHYTVKFNLTIKTTPKACATNIETAATSVSSVSCIERHPIVLPFNASKEEFKIEMRNIVNKAINEVLNKAAEEQSVLYKRSA